MKARLPPATVNPETDLVAKMAIRDVAAVKTFIVNRLVSQSVGQSVGWLVGWLVDE